MRYTLTAMLILIAGIAGADLLTELYARRANSGVTAPTPNLWWDFTYNAGYYPDLSTNHNDMLPTGGITQSNAAPALATSGSKSIHANASGERTRSRDLIMASMTNASSRSWMAWGKFDTVDTANRALFAVPVNSLEGFFWAAGARSWGTYDYVGSPQESTFARSADWQHYGFSITDGTNVAFWGNGTSQGSKTFTYATGSGYADAGTGENGGSYFFNGLVSEMVGYDRVLSASEWTNAYNGSLPTDYKYRWNWETLYSSTVADLSGNGFAGVVLAGGATAPYYTYTGAQANSYSFDGADDVITGATTLVTAKWSASVNVYQTEVTSVIEPTLFRITDGTNYVAMVTYGGNYAPVNGVTLYTVTSGGSFAQAVSATNIVGSSTLNQWNHVFVDYDNTRTPKGRIFINNENITLTGTYSDTGSRTLLKIEIGNRTDSAARALQAYQDDFRLWTNTLSDAERTAVYNERRQ